MKIQIRWCYKGPFMWEVVPKGLFHSHSLPPLGFFLFTFLCSSGRTLEDFSLRSHASDAPFSVPRYPSQRHVNLNSLHILTSTAHWQFITGFGASRFSVLRIPFCSQCCSPKMKLQSSMIKAGRGNVHHVMGSQGRSLTWPGVWGYWVTEDFLKEMPFSLRF